MVLLEEHCSRWCTPTFCWLHSTPIFWKPGLKISKLYFLLPASYLVLHNNMRKICHSTFNLHPIFSHVQFRHHVNFCHGGYPKSHHFSFHVCHELRFKPFECPARGNHTHHTQNCKDFSKKFVVKIVAHYKTVEKIVAVLKNSCSECITDFFAVSCQFYLSSPTEHYM